MEITVEQVDKPHPVAVLSLRGELDASNYQDLIAKAKEVYTGGVRHILIDMSGLSFMSSSGLVALHSAAMILQGEAPDDPSYGWEAFHAIERDRERGKQPFIKIAGPQPKVAETLRITGMDEFIEVFADRETALASFSSA